jgi:polysaccharide deacetylase family protein (PEP-CTERM system associated)
MTELHRDNGGSVRHAFTVDVEDWYHDGYVGVWDAPQHRVETNTLHLLDLLAAHDSRGTFFFLGEVAEGHPSLVRRVAEAGHEIGSHGYRHRHLSEMLWREFRDDARRSRLVLEDASGQPIRGYRAPYFSIKADVHGPIEILAEAGFQYDSSILPIDRPPGLELVCPRSPFRHHNGLWEVPVATLQMFFFWHLPLASGAGLRIIPPSMLRRWVEKFERDVGSGVFYLHPWELDPASPTQRGAGRWLLRVGRERLPERLRLLLKERTFGRVDEVFPQLSS